MTKKNKSKKKSDLSYEILKLYKRSPKKRYHAKQIIKKLRLTVNVDTLESVLERLAKKGQITLLENGKYKLNRLSTSKEDKGSKGNKGNKGNITIGRVDMTRRGSAFIISDDLEVDIHVPPKRLNYAMHGDTVKVEYAASQRGSKPTGTILEIVERGTDHFIGVINISTNYAFLIPDNQRLNTDIFIPLEHIKEAKNGEKVVVKIIKWQDAKTKSPIGKVNYVLGKSGSADIEMKSILIQQGFNLTFPEAVIAESEKLNDKLSKSEIKRRRDFREITTFTIDPDTAKDFDDALSIQYLEDGNCEIGVHIADVTHYIKEGTALDKEAYLRSTSVYLVDRVCPMLPEKLSNVLCSLRPGEDKCTFSAVFTFDKDNKIVDRWFGKTLIHSDRRFTYEEAQEIIESGEGEFAAEIKQMNKIAKVLRKEKFKNGAINFESPEVKFKLDEEGNPVELYLKSRKEAHMLIEDFMLLANREVATFIQKKQGGQAVPFVYRVHDLPDQSKLSDFALFASELGFKMAITTPKQIAATFNALTKESVKKEELKVLLPLAIRTMSKAEYSTENIGHYGLAFDNYSHFTSPIRRYSDVLVHRLLEKNIDATYRADEEELGTMCKHISSQERKAMAAERESIKYKQAEYLEKHIGKTFDGVISGMIERGLFVELIENFCEGFISFESMPEPTNYEGNYKAVGRHSGTVYKLGKKVKVSIVSVDFAKRRVEMEIAEEE